MKLHLNPSSGIPLYQQLVEQLKLAIQTGSLHAGDQLPSVRRMAEEALINPNTVVRAYKDLESEGVIEIRHGSGAFILDSLRVQAELMRKAKNIVKSTIGRLQKYQLTESEIRRLIENELSQSNKKDKLGKRVA